MRVSKFQIKGGLDPLGRNLKKKKKARQIGLQKEGGQRTISQKESRTNRKEQGMKTLTLKTRTSLKEKPEDLGRTLLESRTDSKEPGKGEGDEERGWRREEEPQRPI